MDTEGSALASELVWVSSLHPDNQHNFPLDEEKLRTMNQFWREKKKEKQKSHWSDFAAK